MKRRRVSGRDNGEDSTRDRILAAALEVFAERGFDGARTRDIADRANANLGLIQYYFGGKEPLWKAAVTRAFAELQAELAAALPPSDDSDALAWLEHALRQFVRFVARHPEFMRVMNDEAKRDSRRMRWLANRFVRPMTDAVTTQVARAQAEGLMPNVSPVSLRYIAIGAAGLVFSQAPECRYLTGVDPTDPAFAERHADALIEVLTGRSRNVPSRRRPQGRAGRRSPSTQPTVLSRDPLR